MSIASEIERLQTAKANIKSAINNKGGSLTTETLDQYASVINNLPSSKEEETKTVTPNFSSGNVVVTPTTDKVMTQVTINKDGNLIADNIKSGVTIFGITGTYSGTPPAYTLAVSLSSSFGSSVTVEHIGGTQTAYPESTTSIADVTKIISINHSDGGGSFTVNGLGVSLPYTLTEDSALVGQFWCLTGDTLITLSDHSVKRIDELQLTDDYLSYDLDTGKLVKDSGYHLDNTWTRSYEKMADRYNKCTFDDGTIIKEVHGHRFFNVTKGEFIYLMFWEIGDRIYKMDGTTPKLIAKETIYEPVSFYSVSTKKHHNGFANGCLYGDRHTQKYEITLVDGKPLQNKDKPTDISIVWRERKLQEDKTKYWIERREDK